MDPLILFQQLLVLSGMMLLGFFAARKGWMTDSFCKTLSTLVLNIFNPIMLLSSAVGKDPASAGALLGQNLVLVAICFGAFIALSYPLMHLMRVPRQKRPMTRVLLVFSNYGFMGIPLVAGLYGSGAVIFVSFYMLAMTALFYTYGLAQLSGSFSIKKVVNVGTVACLVATALFLSGVQVPGWVQSFLSYTGNTCVPLPMMIIGASLAKTDFRKLLTCWRYYLFIFVKMLALPILLVLAVRRLPFDATILGVFMLMTAMPIGSVPALSVQECCGPELGREASELAVLTTVATLITAPIVSFFL